MSAAQNVTDRNGAVEMIALNLDSLSSVNKFLVDGGYSGEKFAGRIRELLPDVEVEVVRRNELYSFKVLPKRWIVERSFGCLAFISILMRRF